MGSTPAERQTPRGSARPFRQARRPSGRFFADVRARRGSDRRDRNETRSARSAFPATKVWTTGQQQGVESMEKSLAKLRVKRIDLMQVHNLVDAQTHLATLRGWKEQGRVRYLGITHYTPAPTEKWRSSFAPRSSISSRSITPFSNAEPEEQILPLGAGSRRCGHRESPVRRRRSLLACAPEAAAGMGRGIRLPFLGAVLLKMDRRPSRRHLRDSRYEQSPSSGRQPAGRHWSLPDAELRRRMVDTVAKL